MLSRVSWIDFRFAQSPASARGTLLPDLRSVISRPDKLASRDKQFADHRLGFDGMNLDRFAIFFRIGHTRDLRATWAGSDW